MTLQKFNQSNTIDGSEILEFIKLKTNGAYQYCGYVKSHDTCADFIIWNHHGIAFQPVGLKTKIIDNYRLIELQHFKYGNCLNAGDYVVMGYYSDGVPKCGIVEQLSISKNRVISFDNNVYAIDNDARYQIYLTD